MWGGVYVWLQGMWREVSSQTTYQSSAWNTSRSKAKLRAFMIWDEDWSLCRSSGIHPELSFSKYTPWVRIDALSSAQVSLVTTVCSARCPSRGSHVCSQLLQRDACGRRCVIHSWACKLPCLLANCLRRHPNKSGCCDKMQEDQFCFRLILYLIGMCSLLLYWTEEDHLIFLANSFSLKIKNVSVF